MAISVEADLDGDGQLETVQGAGSQTRVIKNGAVIWQSNTAIDGWNRSDDDQFYAGDVDGDHCQEILVANNHDKWTGLFKWRGAALHTIWATPSQISNPQGAWLRGNDFFLPGDFDHDGAAEIVVWNNNDLWTGMLKWEANANAIQPVWMSPSPLSGPSGQWNRRSPDVMRLGRTPNGDAVDVDGPNGWHGVLEWENGALVPTSITKDKDTKEQSKDDKDDKDDKDAKEVKDDKDDKDDKEEKDEKEDKDDQDGKGDKDDKDYKDESDGDTGGLGPETAEQVVRRAPPGVEQRRQAPNGLLEGKTPIV